MKTKLWNFIWKDAVKGSHRNDENFYRPVSNSYKIIDRRTFQIELSGKLSDACAKCLIVLFLLHRILRRSQMHNWAIHRAKIFCTFRLRHTKCSKCFPFLNSAALFHPSYVLKTFNGIPQLGLLLDHSTPYTPARNTDDICGDPADKGDSSKRIKKKHLNVRPDTFKTKVKWQQFLAEQKVHKTKNKALWEQ